MSLSKLASKCRTCPFKDNCDHKQMEGELYFPEIAAEVAESSSAQMAESALRPTMTIMINGNPTVVYKDQVEKELYKSLYAHLGLQYGG